MVVNLLVITTTATIAVIIVPVRRGCTFSFTLRFPALPFHFLGRHVFSAFLIDIGFDRRRWLPTRCFWQLLLPSR